MKFTLPSADLNSAEEGLLHVIGVLRERLSVKPELTATAQALEAAMADPAGPVPKMQLCRASKPQRQVSLDGESQRRDLDRDPDWGAMRTRHIVGDVFRP